MNLENSALQLIVLIMPLSLALPFYATFTLKRKRWESLIPAWILSILPIITPLSELTNSDLLACFYIFAIALPFQVVYLVNRQFKWALIIAEILGGMAVVPLTGLIICGSFRALLVIMTIGLPFLLISLVKNNHWHVIISGIAINMGILTVSDILSVNIGLQQQVPFVSLLTIGSVLMGAVLLAKKDHGQSVHETLESFLQGFSVLLNLASSRGGKMKTLKPEH
jgi:hypothetical protein